MDKLTPARILDPQPEAPHISPYISAAVADWHPRTGAGLPLLAAGCWERRIRSRVDDLETVCL
jgi:hypothetical protein